MVETLSPQSLPGGPDLPHRLAFSHLSEQLELTDETQRRFYEIECIRGNWSVRELRRQITGFPQAVLQTMLEPDYGFDAHQTLKQARH
jgi:hypothetical protein